MAPGAPAGAIDVVSAEDALGIGVGSDVLIVDDDPGNLLAYEAALAPLGRGVVTARSGMAALAKLLEQDFALVLLDVSMPEMGGLETARRIRERPRNQGLPIIFITGMSPRPELVLEAYDVGGCDFVIKPILPELLRAKARVFLQLQERTLELLRQAAKLRDAHKALREREQLHATDTEARRIAEQQNQQKDELLAMLGHELRNPLWAITNALELIKLHGKPHGHEHLVIERQVDHLKRIVEDLVDVSRVTQGKIVLRREAVEVAGAVANAVDTMRRLFERHRHEVDVHVPRDLLVDADRHRFAQVLENLLGNAAKYTPDGGRIEIEAAREDELVRLSVRDNGIGIPSALLSTLFDPFVQGERPLDRAQGGLGIGLTFVRNLVQLHGGSVEAASDGPGTGATFVLRLPGASARTMTAEMQRLTHPDAGLRLLVVEDNTDAAEMLAALLQTLGHSVVVAYDGPTALERVRDLAPHAALLDIGLPAMDGYELAGRLRALPSCANTLLIAITGYGQSYDRERSRAAGFAHHLVKPVELATLTALLQSPDGDD